MLVLSRKRDEKILFQVPGAKRDIEITIIEIEGSRVRLGISADQEVVILRSELANKKIPEKIA